MTRLLRCLPLLLLFLWSAGSFSAATRRRPGPYVAQCVGVTLAASYIADVGTNGGPGFQFVIENNTRKDIRLAQPVPSSAHWYARVGMRWLWRASAGRGGALVNALSEKGAMFAYQPSTPPEHVDDLTVPAHGSQQWTVAMRDDPAIQYRPSCAHCNYPGETEYRAIFAYAYLPSPQEHVPDLLRCGLRSAPVPMPPVALQTLKTPPETH
ncbi:MAG: hypothetical protein ACLGXA_12455 [Acidobacteriota bacterium]